MSINKLFLMLFILWVSSSPTLAYTSMCVDAPAGLNLREGPSTTTNVVELMTNRTQVSVISDLGDWLQVATPISNTGYAYSLYFSDCISQSSENPSSVVINPEGDLICQQGLSVDGFGAFSIQLLPLVGTRWNVVPSSDAEIYQLQRPIVRRSYFNTDGQAVSISESAIPWVYAAHNYTLPGRAITHLYFNGGEVCLNGQIYTATAYTESSNSIAGPLAQPNWMVFLKTTSSGNMSYYVLLSPSGETI